MSKKESQEFLDQLVEQAQESGIFKREVLGRIIKTAESNPYIMAWIVNQIDDAQTPKEVLDELELGKGEVAERVFDRSFKLEQVGDDGRATVLALTLFVPDASRDALAVVAGFGGDLLRVNKAAGNLRRLWLIGANEENERLAVEGLTRSLATVRLSKDDHAGAFRRRFVAHFLNYAKAHAQPTPADYDALEIERDNLLNAMDLAWIDRDSDSVRGIAYALALPVRGMLRVRGYWDEAIKRNEQALSSSRQPPDEEQISAFAHNLAVMRANRGDLEEAKRLFNESLGISKKLGNQNSIATTLHQLATLAKDQGNLQEARRLYNESLDIKKSLGNERGFASSLHQLAILAQTEGDLPEAQRLYKESLEIEKKFDNPSGMAITLHQLATVAQAEKDLNEARRLHNESLTISRTLGDQSGIASTLHELGTLARAEGDLVEARRLYNESFDMKKKLGDQHGIAETLHQLGMLAQDQGDLREARQLYDRSLLLNRKLGDQSGIGASLGQLGRLAEDEGNKTEAARLFRESLDILEKLKSPSAEIARQSLERVKGKNDVKDMN
jgi:tetratricopeptide (TPR) repeat protein